MVDLNFEIDLTGFETAEIDFILEDAREASGIQTGPEDDAPACAGGVALSRVNDLWSLGNHRLLCGDAREQASYDLLLEGQKAQFAFTDPPYNVAIDGNVCGLGHIRHREFAMASGEMTDAEFTGFLKTNFERLAANTADGSIHMICMDWRHQGEMLAAGREVYSELKNLCVWNKSNAGMGHVLPLQTRADLRLEKRHSRARQ